MPVYITLIYHYIAFTIDSQVPILPRIIQELEGRGCRPPRTLITITAVPTGRNCKACGAITGEIITRSCEPLGSQTLFLAPDEFLLSDLVSGHSRPR